ncbi:MAG: VWA domain-containing protein [candidate division Zixibacteria bacterium]|nr:VWA domain-containing protein [candidate division Zixibacteria bacterium]
MTFLNSIFLAALAAVVIPLLIHFLSRRRIKIIDFSSLRFLMVMQKSKLRWLKILELLLLLIRMMIIALIALAFARPALTGKHAASHAPASIVVLLDDSPSVERLSPGGTVFDELKRGVGEIIDMLKASDEITLISLSGTPTVNGPYSDFERAREMLNSYQPLPSTPGIREGLRKAGEILAASHNLNREVYIFSDFQRGEWWDGSFENLINTDYRYFALRYGNDNAENVGIQKIEFPPQLLAPGEDFELKASIRNYNEKAVQNRLVELFIDGSKRAQSSVDLKPNGAVEAGFTVTPDQPGNHSGYFEIEDDDYSPDNRFYFNFEIPRRITVLGVAETPEAIRILYNIIGRTETGYIEFDGVNVSGFSRQNLSSYDVIIINDVSALSPAYFNSLNDFISSGGGLLCIFGGNSNVDSYKSFLSDKAGLIPGAMVSASGAANPDAYFNLDDFDLTHPIFKVYSPQSLEPLEIPPLKLAMYYPFIGGISLARVDANKIVLAQSKNARVMTMGFGLDSRSSDISVHSFVVPFIIRTVEYLASTPSTAEEYFVSGRLVTVSLPQKVSSSAVKLSRAGVSLSGIDNGLLSEAQTIEVSRGAYGAFVNIPNAGYPGFYSLSVDTDTVGFFSVNHDSSESSPETIEPDRLKDILGDELVYIDKPTGIEEQVMQAKFGFELWKYCLALALILLIVESILVRKAR